MSNVTSQQSPTFVIGEAHAAAVAILSAPGRELFEAGEVASLLLLAEAAVAAAQILPGSEAPRDDLVRRIDEGRAQLSDVAYISATRAQDIALDCWGPLEALAGLLN